MTLWSPSHHYKLWINPSEPEGSGSGTYRESRDGKALWEKRLPFTLYEAYVTDDGLVGGYAYTEGEMGVGSLVVTLMDRSGRVVLEDRIPRAQSRMMHAYPEPSVRGLIMDPGNNRMLSRIWSVSQEEWRVYRLNPPGLVRTVAPKKLAEELGDITQVRAVAGTPLWVASSYLFDDASDQMGQEFALLDESDSVVWRLKRPGDFESGAKEEHRFDLRTEAMQLGTILRSDQSGRFELRFVKQAQVVTFGVTRKGSGWEVKEIGRRPFKHERTVTSPPPLKVPSISLNVEHRLQLPMVREEPTAIKDVGPFFFWGRDRIVFLHRRSPAGVSVVTLSGRAVRQIPLPKLANIGEVEQFFAQTSGSKFILVTSRSKDKGASWAWRLDVATGRWEPLSKFKAFWVRSLAAAPDGHFATISIESRPFTMVDHVTHFGPDGTTIWDKVGDGYGGQSDEILSPEDLDFDAHGRIVVLDVIRHHLQTFDRAMKLSGDIDLDKRWGREASYPTSITCLPDGRFWLNDFGTERPTYLLAADGGIIRNFKPSFTSGKRFEPSEDLRVDSAGNPWVTNGDSIFRLDEKGLAAQTLGNAPRRSGLGSIEGLHVSADGRVYALDQATSAVYVFDSLGKSLFLAKPQLSEFDDKAGPGLDVTRSGDIYISGGRNGDLLHFSPSGRRTGFVPWGEGKASDAYVLARPTWRWRGESLIDERGRKVFRLRRFPDQSWMGGPDAIAPDGRMMAYDQSGRLTMPMESPGENRLAFYRADGKPEVQVSLPVGMPEIQACAFDGSRCYFATAKGLIAVDRRGHALWCYRPNGWDSSWQVFPSRGGLALFDRGRTIIWVKTG